LSCQHWVYVNDVIQSEPNKFHNTRRNVAFPKLPAVTIQNSWQHIYNNLLSGGCPIKHHVSGQ